MKKIPIVFATNENYAPYAGVTITSLVENSSKDFFYDIYVFYTDLSEDTINRFHRMNGKNFSVTCKDVNAYIDRELLYENFHFSKEMYYRILIPTILEQYKKVIYLDCDMVVLGDIAELYQTDLKGYVLAGVNDIMHKTSKNYVANTVKLDPQKYINSGMLVINCEEFIKQKIKEKCFETLATIDIKLRYPDQDIINITCQNKIMYLDSCWNYIWHYNFPRYNQTPDLLLSEEDQKLYEEKSKNIKILHYTSNIKPWNNYNTELSEYFFKYVGLTESFKDIIYERYNKLGMKNYVVFQHFDCFEDEFVFVGAFCTLEKYLNNDKICVDINGKTTQLQFFYERIIDIRNLCYSQNYFRIILKRQECQDGFKIRFFRESRPNEKLNIVTGRYFPIDSKLGSRAYITHNLAFYIANNELKFTTFGRNARRKHEKLVLKKLKTKLGKSGKKSYWVRKVYHLTKLFFRRKIWLISDRMDSAGDNGEAFFKFIRTHKPKNTKVYFVLRKSSADYKRLKKYGKVVEPLSLKYDLLFLHCRQTISSQLDTESYYPYYLDYLKDLRVHNKITFLQHGIIKDDLSRAYSKFSQNMNFFVTSAQGEYKSLIETPAYGLESRNVVLTGLPRYDYLENEPEKVIYILPTWRNNLLKDVKEKNINELQSSQFYKFYSELLNNNELSEFLQKTGYVLKFVPHHLAKLMFEDFVPQYNNIEIVTDNVSYNEIFKSGSLLVTDYSSTAFDFVYLKKPVIYCQFDKDSIYSDHTYKMGYFDYGRDGFGPVTYNLKECIQEIKKCVLSNCSMNKKYMKRVESFFAYRDKNNCQRVLDVIDKYDFKQPNLYQRYKTCIKDHGFKYTIKRIWLKIIGRI